MPDFLPKMDLSMEDLVSDISVDDQNVPTLLFVPGIEHEEGDLDELRKRLETIARIVTVKKEEIGFVMSKKGEWETNLQNALREVAEKNNTVGIIGHSFGCFRTLRLLQNGTHMEFAVLLNPPANKIDESLLQRNAFPFITNTQTEKRLFPLVQDLNDSSYAAFIMRHARHEIETGNIARPWNSTEFKTLKNDMSFPDLLRQVQPDVPIDIIHSPTDPWEIRNWGDTGMHIHKHAIDRGGHYLATSYPDDVSTIVRESLERTVGIPTKSARYAA